MLHTNHAIGAAGDAPSGLRGLRYIHHDGIEVRMLGSKVQDRIKRVRKRGKRNEDDERDFNLIDFFFSDYRKPKSSPPISPPTLSLVGMKSVIR